MTCAFSHWPRHTYAVDEYFTCNTYVGMRSVGQGTYIAEGKRNDDVSSMDSDRKMGVKWKKMVIQNSLKMISHDQMGGKHSNSVLRK